MKRRSLYRLAVCAGLMSLPGCLGQIGSNLDILLAPDAYANALVLPFRAIGNIAVFLARFG